MLLSAESIPVIHILATDQQPIERDGDSIGGVGQVRNLGAYCVHDLEGD